jgi:hypothetical protein
LKNPFRKLDDRLNIPRTVQQAIPVLRIYEDGIFEVTKGVYSRTYLFEDINYASASEEDQKTLFLQYSELLNALDTEAVTKITINNHRLNQRNFEEKVLLPKREDGLEGYREEYNQMLLQQASQGNSIVQEKYFTVSVPRQTVEEARIYFARLGSTLGEKLARLGSKCTELDCTERLRILHDFYRTGEETFFSFDLCQTMRRGHHFKDVICPDSMEFHRDYIRLGNRFARVVFLREYATFVKDDMLQQLTQLSKNLMLSIDIVPVPMDEAVKKINKILLGIETNITNWQRKQNERNNFTASIPFDMEQQQLETREVLNDLISRDQRMMLGTITIVHTADTLEELNSDTARITSVAQERMCQLSVLHYQQLDGLNSVLPVGCQRLRQNRTLTTESLAVFMPFQVQEVFHPGGIYYGINTVSRNLMMVDRRKLLNGNAFILGVSGSGKSFVAKNEIVNLMLSTDADIMIIDPEREYSPLVEALGGQVVQISATSKSHINAMDLNREYGDGANPVILKSEFIMSLCEQLVDGGAMGAKQKSIIDRCTAKVYRYYQQGNYQGTPPTLQDFRQELLEQPEPEAKALALDLELFTSGSLNTFAQPTNVNTENRLLCYDILELGEQLKGVGMLVVLDSILNRITANRAKGRNTFLFIDEIYLLFQHTYSANFLFTLWKRVRKYGAFASGLTQNVEDLLNSPTARTMLANSEFVLMLNTAATDREPLANLMHISEKQMDYITDSDAGCGLMKVGSSLVPFVNRFPHNKLYQLMSTKPGDQSGEIGHEGN